MRSILTCLALAVLLCRPAFGQKLTPEELQRATEHLERTAAALLAATRGLSDAQAAFKPAPERWSVVEVAEHIAAAEDMLRGLIETQVLQAPARTTPVDVQELDTYILTTISDRTHKAKAPEPLVPTRRFGTLEQTLAYFQESRARTLALLAGSGDLRAHAIDSPFGRQLDGYQWFLMISAHCERHTRQIEEVKADPAFPE